MTENAKDVKTEEAAKPEVNPLQRSLTLKVNNAELEAGVAAELKRLGKKAKLPGFRPGHVPAAKVAEMYGYEARMRVMNNLLDAAYRKAAEESGLRIAGFPEIAPAEGSKPGDAELVFTAKVEVYPEFDLPDLSGLELKRYNCDVTDAEVAKTLDIMAKQRATYTTEEGRAAQKDDRVTVNFKGMKDGVAFEGGSADNYKFIVGAGMMLPEFDQAVEGMKAGDKKSFNLTFPANYQAKDLAGKEVTFDVECVAVEKANIPAIDDEFAKKLGMDGVDAMKAEVRKNLEREVKVRVSNRTRGEVMNKLQELCTFRVPSAMIQEESERMAQAMMNDFMARGMLSKKDRNRQLPASLFTEQAAKRVALSMFVGKLIDENKITASEDDVKRIVKNVAEAYEEPAEMEKYILSNPQTAQNYHNLALEERVVDFVLGKAKTTDDKLSFDDLMKNPGSL